MEQSSRLLPHAAPVESISVLAYGGLCSLVLVMDCNEAASIKPEIEIIFLGWDRPMVETAVATLLAEGTKGNYDFSDLAVVVPTAEAGRKLRAALAQQASLQDQAVLVPEIMTPEGVLAWGEVPVLVSASDAESMLAWVEVLLELDCASVPQVFPRPPTQQDFPWALQMAATLRRLQYTLGEAGWSIAVAAARFGPEFTEAERWEQLSTLERRYEASLARAGLQERNRALARAALSAQPPVGLRKLFIFGVPEPLPLVRTAWAQLAERGLAITIGLQAPPTLAEAFDAWGRPLPAIWTERPLPLFLPQEQICLLQNPASQAERLLQLAEEASGALAIGVADQEILPLALAKFSERGIPVFNPEGVTFGAQSLHWLLSCWQELLASRSWAAWAQWMRIPEVTAALLGEIVLPPDDKALSGPTALLREADGCAAAHLPTTITDALGALKRSQKESSALGQALRVSARWLDDFANEDFAVALTDYLELIYRGVDWPRGDPKTTAFRQASEHLLTKLDDITRAAASLPRRLDAAQLLQLLLRLLRDLPLFPEGGTDSVELSGWLEMPWQTADHLVVAGLNDGLVPTAITADAWLPHSLRGTLNLRTNDERFATDAYRLAAMLHQRAAKGRVELLLGRESASGDGLTPSRLLLLCPAAELPTRVNELFADPPEDSQVKLAEWERAWRLRPRLPENLAFTKISATMFLKYLQCPFRYFLEVGLKMQEYDAQKQEMDALEFGNLCHFAFEELAMDPIMKTELDVGRVAAFLKAKAAEKVQQIYGSNLSVPLLVQRSSIQQRLAAAAPVLVQSRLEGWEIMFVEINVRDLLGEPWMVEGVEISGRIDMVEYHPQLEKWRIIDYKTSAKPVTPEQAHLVPVPTKAREARPFEAGFIEAATLPDGRRWKNLQLPLYAAALRRRYQQPVEAAYLNLPPATSLVKLSDWPELVAGNLLDQAVECATAVIRCIKDAQFWPPNPKPEYENFARLGLEEWEDAIDPSGLLADAAARRAGGVVAAID